MAYDDSGVVVDIPVFVRQTTDNAFLHSCYGTMAAKNLTHLISRGGPTIVSEHYGDGSNTSFSYDALSYHASDTDAEGGLSRGFAYVPEPYNTIRYAIRAADIDSGGAETVKLFLGTGPWIEPEYPHTRSGTWKEISFDFGSIAEGDAGSKVTGTVSFAPISFSDRMLYWWVLANDITVMSFHLSAEL